MPRSPLFRRLILALQAARRENRAACGLPPPIPRGSAGWSRRKFVKTSAALAGGVAAGTLLPAPLRTAWAAGSGWRVAVVGGGLAGLSAAYRLNGLGVDVSVYEASSRLGGRIHTVSGLAGEGLDTDLGAELINLDHADVLELARVFGLELFDRKLDAAQQTVPVEAFYFGGEAISAARLAEDLRPLAEQIGADAALLDADYATHAPRLDRISVARYLRQHADKIPATYVQTLIENSIRTEFGVEPGRSSALQLMFNLPVVDGEAVEVLSVSDETYSVVGGSERLIDGLAGALAGRINTGHRLTAIRRRGRGFRLQFTAGRTVDADAVVIAVPFTALRDVELAVPVPAGLQRFIRQARLGSNEKLIAGFNRRFWRQDGGFADEAWTDLGFSEVWDETQRQPAAKEAALTFFMGGRETAAVRRGRAEAVGRAFVDRLSGHLPDAAAASNGRFIRTNWTRNRNIRGAYTSFSPGQLTRFADYFWVESENPEDRQEVYSGRLVFAGEHVSDEFFGFMNGAAQTGRLAADLISRWIAEDAAAGAG